MNEKLEKTLSKTVLNQKQAKVYLACLDLGKAKVPEIARKAGIKRTTAYGILDELVSLGFLSYVSDGKAKLYKAQNPNTLISLLDEKKSKLVSIVPSLESLYSSNNVKPKMQFFEGRQGIKRIFEEALECSSKNILQIVKVRDWVELVGREYAMGYMKMRIKKNITVYDIHPKSGDIYDENYGKESELWKRKVRYLPLSVFYVSMMLIYDNKVAIVSTKEENFGFILESKEFSGALRAQFDLMWNLGSKEPESE